MWIRSLGSGCIRSCMTPARGSNIARNRPTCRKRRRQQQHQRSPRIAHRCRPRSLRRQRSGRRWKCRTTCVPARGGVRRSLSLACRPWCSLALGCSSTRRRRVGWGSSRRISNWLRTPPALARQRQRTSPRRNCRRMTRLQRPCRRQLKTVRQVRTHRWHRRPSRCCQVCRQRMGTLRQRSYPRLRRTRIHRRKAIVMRQRGRRQSRHHWPRPCRRMRTGALRHRVCRVLMRLCRQLWLRARNRPP